MRGTLRVMRWRPAGAGEHRGCMPRPTEPGTAPKGWTRLLWPVSANACQPPARPPPPRPPQPGLDVGPCCPAAGAGEALPGLLRTRALCAPYHGGRGGEAAGHGVTGGGEGAEQGVGGGGLGGRRCCAPAAGPWPHPASPCTTTAHLAPLTPRRTATPPSSHPSPAHSPHPPGAAASLMRAGACVGHWAGLRDWEQGAGDYGSRACREGGAPGLSPAQPTSRATEYGSRASQEHSSPRLSHV